jgi:hypothetical protein
MRAFVLQDWVTIRGGTSITSVVQNEASYLSLDTYQDVVLWVQVSEVGLSGSGAVTLNLETAPLKDETLFRAMTNCAVAVTVPVMTPPTVIPVITVQSGTAVPLSRYLRWHITTSGSFTSAWDLTFRVLVAANQIFTFNPTFSTQ